MLIFYDDIQVGVIGLDEIMDELYSEGRQANEDAAKEIMNRLEAKNNYIPSSDRARRDYAYALLKEYRKYVKDQADKKQ
jgi:hypothetical protein